MLISLLVFALVVFLAWYLATLIPDPKINKAAQVIVIVVAIIYLLTYVLPLPHR